MTVYILIAVAVVGIIICINPFRRRPRYGRSQRTVIRQDGHYRREEPYIPTYRHKI